MMKYLRRDFKFWLNVFTFAALIFLIVITWEQILEAFGRIADLHIVALLGMIPMQLLSYFAVSRLYKDFFDAHGDRIKLREMYKISLELNFINHVFPSGGVSGFSYLSLRLKKLGVPASKSTLAQLLRFALTFLSFIIILLLGMVVLAFGHDTSPLIILVSSAIIFTTIFGAAVGIFIISKPQRIKAFVSWLPKALNYVFRYFKKGQSIIDMAKLESTLEDLHQDYVALSSNRRLVKKLLGWALLINITEVATIYLVYVAFGELINPGALIIAYAVANFAGLIAVLPGGVGVYEGLMTAVLTSAGVGGGLALSATVVYRVLSMVFFLPVGYLFYHRALRSPSGDELEAALKQENEEDHDAPDIHRQ